MLRATLHKPESEIKNFIQPGAIIPKEDLDLTKRQFIRLNYKVKVSLTISALQKTINAYSDNVSESGIFINTNKIIPVGTAVEIKLYPNKDEEISISGKVVWICESVDKDNAGYAVYTPTVNLLSLLNLNYAYEESKREFIRISHKIKTNLIFKNGRKKKIKGITRNISYQGLFIQSPKLLPVYSVVTIQLYPFNAECIELKGAVVWQNNTSDGINNGMGLYVSTEVDFSVPCQDHEKQGRMIKRYLEYINRMKNKNI